MRRSLAQQQIIIGRHRLAPAAVGVVARLLRQQRSIVVGEIDDAVVVRRREAEVAVAHARSVPVRVTPPPTLPAADRAG